MLLLINLNWKFSEAIHSLVPSVQAFTSKTHLTTYKRSNDPNSLSIPLLRRKFHFGELLSKTVTFWNRFSKRFFINHYNLNLFKSRVSRYLRTTVSFNNAHNRVYLCCFFLNNNISIDRPAFHS